MNKEVFNIIRKESAYIGILFLALLVVFKIVYYKESITVLLRSAASLFWLFAVPGYFIMLYWREKLDFTERILIGIGLSAAIIGISSYYLGLIGMGIKYHGIFMPLALLLIGLGINLRKKQ